MLESSGYTYSTLMKELRTSDKLITIYKIAWRHNPEEHNVYTKRPLS
jgi:hypothetical protein